ncbi:MAG: gmhB [Labilithrix sp.]|nr:gmhB [Labilithrix sp.]
MRAAAFLDRDGTIIEDPGYLSDPAGVRLLPGAAAALRALQRDRALVIVSNQSGVPRGLVSAQQHGQIQQRLADLLAGEGIEILASYYCLHLPDQGCACRKPAPGMIVQACGEHALDPRASIMIGDKPSDVAAGHAAGCTTARLGAPLLPTDPRPDHAGVDWPSLMQQLENAWKR